MIESERRAGECGAQARKVLLRAIRVGALRGRGCRRLVNLPRRVLPVPVGARTCRDELLGDAPVRGPALGRLFGLEPRAEPLDHTFDKSAIHAASPCYCKRS